MTHSSSIQLSGHWLPEIKSTLEDLIRRRGVSSSGYNSLDPPVAVFDWDNTMILGDVGEGTYRYQVDYALFHSDWPGFWERLGDYQTAELRSAYNAIRQLPLEQARQTAEYLVYRKLMTQVYPAKNQREGGLACTAWAAQVLAGFTGREALGLGLEAIDRELNRPVEVQELRVGPEDPSPCRMEVGVRIYQEMRQLVSLLQAHGFAVWVVSATNLWTVQAFARCYGIPFDHVLAMRPETRRGVISAELSQPATYGPGKAEAVRRFIGRRPVLVAGDNVTDLDMLEDSGDLRLVIDRGVEAVRKRALERGWLLQPRFPA